MSHPIDAWKLALLRNRLPRSAGKTLQQLAAERETDGLSITKLKELTPIRLATQRPLANDETWSGFPLTHVRVSSSLYGGPHYRLSLYGDRITPKGQREASDTMPFIPIFVVRWSCTHEQLGDPEFRAQVEATAEAYKDMLNMRRVK